MSATMVVDPMEMPAATPPPDVIPNLDNPHDQDSMVLAVMSVCLAISTMGVILRTYSRWYALNSSFQIQDYLLWASFCIYCAILGMYYNLTMIEHSGWFIHMWEFRLGGLADFMKTGIMTTCMFLGFLIAIKSAILIEWVRIFLPDGGTRDSAFFWACHGILWANVVFCVVMIILVNLSCVPYEYLWDRSIVGGYCRINTAYTSLSSAVWAFVTDLFMLVVPQRIIWKLNMSRSKRAGVSVVFLLGIAACAAAIVRLYYTAERSIGEDVTYQMSAVQLTAVGEGACVILVMCVPTLPKAFGVMQESRFASYLSSFRRLVPGGRSSHGSRSGGSKGYEKKSYGSSGYGAENNSWDGTRAKTSTDTHIGSGSERNLVSTASYKEQDPELAMGIMQTTKFETNEQYVDPEEARVTHPAQHAPWVRR